MKKPGFISTGLLKKCAFAASVALPIAMEIAVIPLLIPVAGIAAGAVAGLAIGIGGLAAGQVLLSRLQRRISVAYPQDGGVPLTSREKTVIYGIFGDNIHLSAVRKHYLSEDFSQAAGRAFDWRTIAFYGAKQHAADYSAAKNAFTFGLFVHEMAHIWQFQNSVSWDRSRKYGYALSDHSRFLDFGMEQQASIVEDYARRFLFKDGRAHTTHFKKTSRLIPAFNGFDTKKSDLRLQKVIEEQFPAARQTRLGQKNNALKSGA